MTTIKENAKIYEPKETKVISDLEKVSVNTDMRIEEFVDKEGKTFTANLTTIEGEEYRVPNSVLKQLKVLIEDDENLEFFKVKKSGEGMQSSYTVIPVKK